jgi:hypothetical protein
MDKFIECLQVGLLAILFSSGCGIPQEQKLADCTTNDFGFTMRVQYRPPYQFLLSMPHSETGKISFAGEIVLKQAASVVADIPISSHDAVPCNWLEQDHGLSCYILTWSRTNQGQRLNDVFFQKHSYEVRVTFTEPPPAQSSLWLSSIAGF